MTQQVVERQPLAEALKARLEAELDDIAWYVTEASNVPLVPNGGGRVVQYGVIHPGAGDPTDQLDLADTVIDLDWPFQINVVGPETNDVLAMATRVDSVIYRWAPTVEGLVCGPCKPQPGFNSGSVQLDRSVAPHRPFLPLQYVTRITRT